MVPGEVCSGGRGGLVLGGICSGGYLLLGVPGMGDAWSGGAWSGGCLLWRVPAPGGAWWRPPDGYCCRQYASYSHAFLLHVSVILFTGGSAPLHAGIHHPTPPRPEAGTSPSDHRQTHSLWSSACWEIWATSGQYASYWNAILLISPLTLDHSNC